MVHSLGPGDLPRQQRRVVSVPNKHVHCIIFMLSKIYVFGDIIDTDLWP